MLYFLESSVSTFFQCILSSFFYVTQNLVLLKFKTRDLLSSKHNSAYSNPQIQVPL